MLERVLPQMASGTSLGGGTYSEGLWSSPSATVADCLPCAADPGAAAAALCRVTGGSNLTYYNWVARATH